MDEAVVVLYESAGGAVNLLIPAACGLSLEQIIAKDIPAGARYQVVKRASIPENVAFLDSCRTLEAALAAIAVV